MNAWRNVFVIAVALVFGVVSHAHADVVVHSAKDLLQDRNVQQIGRVANAVAAAEVVYQQCDKQLGITEAQKKTLLARFNRTTDAYLKAFRSAYTKRVGVLPDTQIVNQYHMIINDQYKQAGANIDGIIHQRRGCQETTVRDVIRFIDKLDEADAKAKAAAAEKEAEGM